jgi:hypothetical protein
MTAAISTRFPPLPPETLRGKAAHVTLALCFLVGGVVLLWSAWDELTCVAGEPTSSGPCGIGISIAGFVAPVGACLALIGTITSVRVLRRPVSVDGSDAWRVGGALVVAASGVVIGLMIPRYACPPGMYLSPVFRFCTSADRSFPAPSPGLPWKFVATGVGVAICVAMIRWRSMPWWLASIVVTASFFAAALLTISRSTGIPWEAPRPYAVADAAVQAADQIHVSSTRRNVPNASAKWVGATIVPA